jgi:hypothetical protein
MMPGQEPYTADELEALHRLVDAAAHGDPGEKEENRAIDPRTFAKSDGGLRC